MSEKESCSSCGAELGEDGIRFDCEGCKKSCCDYCLIISDTGDYCLECMDKLEDVKKKEKKNG